jgi:hypothetical protein
MKKEIVLLSVLVLSLLTSMFVELQTVTATTTPDVFIDLTYGSYTTYVNQRVELTATITSWTPPYTYQWYTIFMPQDVLDRGFPFLPDGRMVSVEVPGANSSKFDFIQSTPGTYNINLRITDSAGNDVIASSRSFIVVQALSSPSPSLTATEDKHFSVQNTLWAFDGSHLVCSFTATSGDSVKLNIASANSDPNRPNDVYIVELEIASANHGTIYLSGTSFMQTIALNYSDTYTISVAKHPFYSTVTVSGTIDLHHNEITNPTPNPTYLPSPSPSPSPSPTPSNAPTPQQTAEPSQPKNFTSIDDAMNRQEITFLIISLIAIVTVSAILLFYFKKRKGSIVVV